jgi:restriction endonuclease S subunit
MRSEWRIRALSDVLEEVIDYRGKTPKKMGGDWTNTGYRVFSAKHIKTGRTVKEAEIRTVSQEVYDKWMQIEVERGDIILTSEAPFGEALYWDSDEKIVLGQRLYGLRADSAVINSKFLYYTVIGHHFQQQLSARSTGTTVRGLRQPDLLKCTVPVPSLATQTAIAAPLVLDIAFLLFRIPVCLKFRWLYRQTPITYCSQNFMICAIFYTWPLMSFPSLPMDIPTTSRLRLWSSARRVQF